MSKNVEYYRKKVNINYCNFMEKIKIICYNFCNTKEKVENYLLSLLYLKEVKGVVMKEEKNIYLMDKPIEDITKDEFDHKSIVDEIVNNIQSNDPPYNIALIGKWGTGKSSILDCVKRKLDKEENNKYLFTMINAWKYEKQEIRKSFILEILNKITNEGEKNKSAIQEIISALNNIFMINTKEIAENKKWYIKLWDIIKQSFMCILPLILMFLFAYLIIDIVLNKIGKTIDDYNSIRLEQFGAFIMAIVMQIGVIIKGSIFGKKPVNIYLEENEKDTDFYEKQLEKAINLYKNEHEDFKSIICVVEDIDRLNANKMVEAISALKSFVGVKDLIFVVPYDTNILCKVLEECKVNRLSNNYEILEGELILNKLFQFKIYMPELIQEDMYEYAKNLIEKENNKIYNLFPNKEILIDEILPILMYEGVNTPREAKQLINSFITKYNIAISRKVIEFENLNSEEVKILALLTVLENDFNEFYSKIISYPNIIQDFLKIDASNKIDGETKEIFDDLNTRIYKGKKMQSLLTFLKYTTTIKIENIERFIYLNDSKIDKVSGGKGVKEFRESLRNYNYKIAKEYVRKIEDISDLVYREMSYNNGNILRKKNIILTLIKIFDSILNDIDKSNIRKFIDSNIKIIDKSEYSNFDIDELLKIINDDELKQCNNIISIFKEKLEKWTPTYFYYNDEKNGLIDEKDILEEKLNILINSYFDLDEKCQEKIRDLFNKIGNYSLTQDDIENSYKVYSFVEFYKFIEPILNINNYSIFGEDFLNKAVLYVKEEKIKLEELKVIQEIYINKDNFDNFTNTLLTNFSKENAEKILNCLSILKDNLKDVSVGTKKIIFNLLEENLKGLTELDGINVLDNILASIVIEILKEDENNDVDALLKKLNEKIYIDETVKTIAKNNLLEKIPNTIVDINEELVGNSQDYYEMFEKVHNKYTLEAKKDLFNQLYKEIPNYKDNIDIIRKLFKILNNRNNKEICAKFIIEIIDYLESKFSNFSDKNVRNELLKFSADNADFLEQNTKEEFFEFINEKVLAINPKLAIECSDNDSFNSIDDIKWNKVISKYIESTKLTINDYINIVDRHANILINDSKLKNNYIEKIINNFEAKKEILKILQKLKIEEDETIVSLYKLFLNYREDSEVIDCLKNIFENKEELQGLIEKIIQEDLDIKLLVNISNLSKKIDLRVIITNILNQYKSSTESYSQKAKIKLLEIIAEIFNGKKIFKDDFTLLAIDVVNNLDTSEVEDIVQILIGNKRILDKESIKILINKLEVTVEKMDENSKNKVKKQLENF